MGQEASLPQAEGDDELEHQARAPPSATNPPLPGTTQSQKNLARTGKMIGAVFHKRQSNPDKDPAAYANSMGIPPPQVQLQHQDPNLLTKEEHQEYYLQQQQLQQLQQQQQIYQMHQQTQMMQQQYYPQGHPQSAVPPQPLPNADIHAEATSMIYVQNPNGSASQPAPGKKGLGLRTSGRGAAIINSMRNLSLGTAMHRAAGTAAGGSPKAGKEVNDWETRWDEDDDSDGEEDEDSKLPATSVPMAAHAGVPMHSQLRPGMDGGHSTPMVSPAKPAPMQQYASPQVVPPQAQKAHLVTATPDGDGIQLDQRRQNKLQPNESEDGLEWDTGAHIEQEETYEKPNVQMFLPLLRVLGKGSFGKVRQPVSLVQGLNWRTLLIVISRLF